MTTTRVLSLVVPLVVATVFLVWMVYLMLSDKVFLLDGKIVKKHKRSTEQLQLSHLSEIKFHYHAVVGFIGIWEFIDKAGASLKVDTNAKGIKELIASLDKELPGFSSKEFDRKFREGDVEDSIDVWKAA